MVTGGGTEWRTEGEVNCFSSLLMDLISSSWPSQAFGFICMGQLIKGMKNFKDLGTRTQKKVMLLKDISGEKPISFTGK